MKRPTFHSESGFTIIELLVATAVFSVILLVITAGVIGFSRQYYRGVVSSNTQATTRRIMAEITSAIQFGGSVTTDLTNGTTMAFCVDNKTYSYVIGQEVKDSSPVLSDDQGYHGLVADNGTTACNPAAVPPSVPTTASLSASQRELLGENMRIAALSVASEDGQTFHVHVRVIYGDNDTLSPDVTASGFDWAADGSDVGCLLDRSTLQYCSVSDLTTTIQKRI